MKFINVFALVLTILLFLVRQRYVLAGICPDKRRTMNTTVCSGGDSSLTSALQARSVRVAAYRASGNARSCCRPKYKRDPDILIDDENIFGVSPVE